MSLTVTQRPSIIFESQTSRWNAVKNPILYKMQRKDFTFNQVNNSGGFIQLQFNATNLVSSFDVGSSVYVKSDNGVYDVFGVVTARSFSTNTLVILDQSYISAAPGGFVNNFTLRPGYKIEIEIYNSDDVSLSEYPLYVPASTRGSITINISPVLRANLSHDFSLDGSQVYDDSAAYLKFYIKYREIWNESAESQTDDNANQFFATLAAMQIPASNGGNIAPYVIPEVDFLTKLDTMVVWRNYPSLLAVIVNEDISSDVYLDTGNDSSLAADYSGKQIVFDLNEIVSDQSVQSLDVIVSQDTSGADPVSEVLPVEMRDACDNPIMLIARSLP